MLREHLHLTWWLGKEALTISQPDDNPGNFMVVMAVPIFYLLLDSSTQDSEVMRFTSTPGWPHPDASRRRALWKKHLHGPQEGFSIFGETAWDKFWAGETLQVGDDIAANGWGDTAFRRRYF